MKSWLRKDISQWLEEFQERIGRKNVWLRIISRIGKESSMAYKEKTLRNGQPNGLKQMPGVKRKSEEKEVLRQSERLLSMSDRRN